MAKKPDSTGSFKKLFGILAVFAVVIVVPITVNFLQSQTYTTNHAAGPSASIYYGVSTDSLQTFEKDAGKGVAIQAIGQNWEGKYTLFDSDTMNQIVDHGSIPMVTWLSEADCSPASWDDTHCKDQTKYQLRNITRGDFDPYITQWAQAAKNWGHPFFLNFDVDINGDWQPWDEQTNGNNSGEFVLMWHHVHDIFTRVGATNATWVWSVSQEYSGSTSLYKIYPGNTYVDWVGMNALNVITQETSYQNFSQLVGQTYKDLQLVARLKPVMIADMGSTEFPAGPQIKAGWITDALGIQLPNNAFPNIKAIVYDNTLGQGQNFTIESSQQSQQAFAAAIALPLYASNQFNGITQSPIPPLTPVTPGLPNCNPHLMIPCRLFPGWWNKNR